MEFSAAQTVLSDLGVSTSKGLPSPLPSTRAEKRSLVWRLVCVYVCECVCTETSRLPCMLPICSTRSRYQVAVHLLKPSVLGKAVLRVLSFSVFFPQLSLFYLCINNSDCSFTFKAALAHCSLLNAMQVKWSERLEVRKQCGIFGRVPCFPLAGHSCVSSVFWWGQTKLNLLSVWVTWAGH